VAVDLVNRRVLRLPRSEGVGALSVSGSRLAAVVASGASGDRSALRVYRIPAPAGEADQRSASAFRMR